MIFETVAKNSGPLTLSITDHQRLGGA